MATSSKPAFTPSSGMLCLNGCGKASNRAHTCPVCLKEGVSGAQFCSPSCFRDNYKTHKAKYHKPSVAVSTAIYNYPEGTKDAFADKFPDFRYTGTLRSVMPIVPVPKRHVPESIEYPDYGREANGQSFKEIAYNRKFNKCEVLTPKKIEAMRVVCKLGREVLDIAAAAIRPGITTLELDAIVHEECMKRNSYPSPLNYSKFPRSVCTSVNEIICHGIPDARPLEDGDIINLDVSLYHGGFHSDLNATYPVGNNVSTEKLLLIKTSRKCLDEAIRACKPGMEYGKLGAIIERVAAEQGFTTNRTYVGHGVNELFHSNAPQVSHYANNRDAGRMRPGQTFTIEPMICIGQEKPFHWPDNWAAATVDGKASAQFEETLLVTETGIEVLTAAPGWKLPEPDA
ncbi:peptidase M24, structural domain-containing protein [Leucosporidium creatinivorum]|uniref:Methionine aminopeptidase n=1 Tax=Leucosporidium creatinivorum TaxID=106004 RepID=A0A1Y2F755_9BASI|nr:peptidase M24, structural domain-containing protein [Leucosporidium creatinivorum]